MRFAVRVLALLAGCLVASAAFAQPYPSKPIRLLVPFPPGGSSDLVVRTYATRLGELLGQPIVVDYKGGAGGSIGAAEVAKAPADGYTLLQVWDTHAVNHHVYRVQYDFNQSFAPISLLVQAVGILVAHPSFQPSTMKAIATLGRERTTQFPAVPAAAEAVPGFEARTWFGLLAPAGTPRDVLTKVHGAVVGALADAKVREAFAARGFEVVASTPEAFKGFLARESELAGGLVRDAGIKPE